MLGIAAALIVLFLVTVFNDYAQFQANLTQIEMALESSDPSKLQASWMTVVLARSLQLLVPALLLGFAAGLMHWHDIKKPKRLRRK